MSDFVKELTFECDTFSDIKRDMTFVLQRLLANMQEKGSSEAQMTLKIDVSLINEYIPNFDKNVKGESRKISKPKFKHKVTSAVQIKDEKSGVMDTEMELVYDEDSGEYVMKPVANTDQMTIFDNDFHYNREESDSPESVPQLTGPVDDDAIDSEYREVEDPEIDEVDLTDDSQEDIEDITDELLDGEPAEDDFDSYDYDEPEDEL